MNVDLFVGHMLYAINHSSSCGDPVSRNLHSGSPTATSNTDSYAHTLPSDASVFEPKLEAASMPRSEKIKAANKRRKKKRATEVVSFKALPPPPDTVSPFARAPLPPREERRAKLESGSALGSSVEGDAVEVKVWVVVGGNKVPPDDPMVLRVPGMTSMGKLIVKTMEAHAKAGRDPLGPSPFGYVMRLAEDDSGRPELDFPALDRMQLLSVLGTDALVLCDNPNAEADIAAAEAAAAAAAAAQKGGGGRPGGSGGGSLAPGKRGSRKGGSSRASGAFRGATVYTAGTDGRKEDGGSGLEGKELKIRIHFPDGSSSVLLFDASVSVQQLLDIISNKRATHLEDCTVHRTDGGVAVDKRTPLGMLPSLRELYLKEASSKVRRGTISKKSPGAAASAGAGPSSESPRSRSNTGTVIPASFQFSEFTAIMYKEYALIKINKAGKRQARVLGIDGDRLHNKTPQQAAGKKKNKLSKLFKSGEVKRPFREWTEVIQIERINDLEFVISFSDSGSAHYEGESVAQVDEIIAKLSVLQARSV